MNTDAFWQKFTEIEQRTEDSTTKFNELYRAVRYKLQTDPKFRNSPTRTNTVINLLNKLATQYHQRNDLTKRLRNVVASQSVQI